MYTTSLKRKVYIPLSLKDRALLKLTKGEQRAGRPLGHPAECGGSVFLPRKEVIHRQVPLAMPCYDLLLITGLTVAPTVRRGLRILPALLS